MSVQQATNNPASWYRLSDGCLDQLTRLKKESKHTALVKRTLECLSQELNKEASPIKITPEIQVELKKAELLEDVEELISSYEGTSEVMCPIGKTYMADDGTTEMPIDGTVRANIIKFLLNEAKDQVRSALDELKSKAKPSKKAKQAQSTIKLTPEQQKRKDNDMEKSKVLKEVSQDGLKLKDQLPKYKKDPEVVKAALENNGLAIEYAPDFQDDDQMGFVAVENNGLAWKFLSPRSKKNYDILIKALCQNGCVIKDLSYVSGWWYDKETMSIGVLQNPKALRYLPLNLQCDRFFMLSIMKWSSGNYSGLSHSAQLIVKEMKVTHGEMIQYMNGFKTDKLFIWQCLAQDGLVLQWLSPSQRDDLQMVLAALSNNKQAWDFVSPRLQATSPVKIAAGRESAPASHGKAPTSVKMAPPKGPGLVKRLFSSIASFMKWTWNGFISGFKTVFKKLKIY